jgi:GDP-L-fucose synthase
MSKILVTGGTGMIGNALQEVLGDAGIFLSSKECDLTNYDKTLQVFKKYNPSYVIHLAAKVGGVVANMSYLGDFFRENIMMNTNVLEASRVCGVGKVISLLSTCIYPDKCQYPLSEDQIHNGPPHFSNYAYAHAKRMLDIQSKAYRSQYGCNFITAVPNNLFGKHDNYDLKNSHVIPAMIRKFHEASLNNRDVVLWGTGTPLREFTYSNDLAKILMFLLENYNDSEPINVGNTKEISIKDMANMIANIMNFKGNIVWDSTKPDGQLRKPSSNSKLTALGWTQDQFIDHETALKETCDWSIKNYPNLRGVK